MGASAPAYLIGMVPGGPGCNILFGMFGKQTLIRRDAARDAL